MSVLVETPDRMVVQFTGMSVTAARDLRHRLLTKTCDGAIGCVEVEHNTSIFPSDYIAQRLSLIPLRAKESVPATCDQLPPQLLRLDHDGPEGLPHLQVDIDVACAPKPGGRLIVTAGDLCGGAAAVYPSQPILTLGPGHALKLRAYVYWAYAHQGVRHRTCTVVHFQDQIAVRIVRNIANNSTFLQEVPNGFKRGPHGHVVRTNTPFYDAIPGKWDSYLTIVPLSGGFIKFTVETDGRQTPRAVLLKEGIKLV